MHTGNKEYQKKNVAHTGAAVSALISAWAAHHNAFILCLKVFHCEKYFPK